MGLLVRELALLDFRSFERLTVAPSEGVTVLVGPNAAGKTNTVEALQLLTAGRSFRRPRPRDLVREGATSARAEARLEGDGRVVDVRCDVALNDMVPSAQRATLVSVSSLAFSLVMLAAAPLMGALFGAL